jgi:hypothetical protein
MGWNLQSLIAIEPECESEAHLLMMFVMLSVMMVMKVSFGFSVIGLHDADYRCAV